MILSDEEVDIRLGHEDNLVNVIVRSARPGRPEGVLNVSPRVQSLIGGLVSSGESQKDVAETFGVSQSLVSKASRGLVGERLSADLVKSNTATTKVDKTESAHELAMDALVSSLTSLKPKISGEAGKEMKAKDLARIAVDMSKAASNLKGRMADSGVDGNKVQVVIVVPPQKKEADYESISSL